MPVSTNAGQNSPATSWPDLTQLLKDRGVRNVMVIDDALDAGPDRWIDLSPAIQDLIRTDINKNEHLAAWLQQENLTPPDNAESPEAEQYLETLKEKITDSGDLRVIWEGYIEPNSKGSAKQEVLELIGHLQELGIHVRQSGVIDPQAPPDDLSVIFVDYALDDANSGDLAVRSIDEINRIFDSLNSSDKPIVVLMSSRTKLTDAARIRFQNETGIMPGMFFAFQKSDMKGISLYVILHDIANNWDKAQALQTFINSVSEATQAAATAVSSMVRGLTLEDFALIQLLSLNADGHPLGEYVLWLTGAYFEQQLGQSEDVRNSKASVDRMVFASPPVTEWGPSDSFVSAYQAAAFAAADPDIFSDRYPVLDDQAKTDSGKPEAIVALHFGDVFVQERGASPKAYVVLTPECDLAFGGSRPFPRNRSVVLLPGKLVDERPFRASSDNATRTELLRWKGKNWRIEWRLKEAEIVALGEFKDWVQAKEFTRMARIEFSFAAAIQHAYAANLTRVGLPVVPPQFHSQNATIYVEDWNKGLQPVCDPVRNGGYLISSLQFEERKCILSDGLLMELQRNLQKAIALATQLPTEEDLEKIPEPRRADAKNRAKDRVDRNETVLRAFNENPGAMIALKGPHSLDNATEAIELSGVTIASNRKLLASQPKTVLTIHLEDPVDTKTTR